MFKRLKIPPNELLLTHKLNVKQQRRASNAPQRVLPDGGLMAVFQRKLTKGA